MSCFLSRQDLHKITILRNVRDAKFATLYHDHLKRCTAFEDRLDQIALALTSCGAVSAEAQRKIDALTAELKQLQSEQRRCIDIVPLPLRNTPEATEVAMKVFSTPELLAHIMLLLDTRSLLRLCQVGRVFRDTLDDSLVLKRHFRFVTYHDPPKVRFPLREMIYGYTQNASKCAPVGLVPLGISVEDESFLLPTSQLGTRARSIQICQPPVRTLYVAAECCRPASNTAQGGRGKRFISETGFTVGDIKDLVERIHAEHPDCEGNSYWRLWQNEDFEPSTRLEFSMALEVPEDAENQPKWVASLWEKFENIAKRNRQSLHRHSFVEARRAALAAHQDPPTLEEFKATLTAEDLEMIEKFDPADDTEDTGIL